MRTKFRQKDVENSCQIWDFVCIALIILLSIITYFRNIIWDNELTLGEDIIKKSPEKERGHNNLGIVYFKQGRPNEAVEEYLTALNLRPDFAEAHYNLGNVYANQGRLDDAIEEYLITLRLTPDDPDTHYNLGNAYDIKGLKEKAKREFETVLKLRPDDTKARQALESVDYP